MNHFSLESRISLKGQLLVNIQKSSSIIGGISVLIFAFAENGYASSYIANDNPDPISRYLVWDAPSMQNHLFDNSDSVWIDGDWHTRNGGFGARYISIYTKLKVTYIRVVDRNHGKRNGYYYYLLSLVKMYPFPRWIGHIALSNIMENGTMVEFTSGSGIRGTWNVKTKQWYFG